MQYVLPVYCQFSDFLYFAEIDIQPVIVSQQCAGNVK